MIVIWVILGIVAALAELLGLVVLWMWTSDAIKGARQRRRTRRDVQRSGVIVFDRRPN